MERPPDLIDRSSLYDENVDLLALQRQFESGGQQPAARVTRLARRGEEPSVYRARVAEQHTAIPFASLLWKSDPHMNALVAQRSFLQPK